MLLTDLPKQFHQNPNINFLHNRKIVMAGSKRVTRQRSRGGRGRGKAQSPNKSKKARVTEIVDISSTIRESNPTGCGKDEKGSQSVKNQQGVDETWMKSSVEEIKDVVTTFTQFMMGNTPTFNTIQAQPGIPRLLPSTPRASSVNMRTEPESMVARKTPSSERWTTSATPLKFSSKECSEFPSDDVTVGQKHYVKEGQDLVYYVNYDPLHCTQSEGRKSGFQLLEWVDMLFKPPRYMVLDEIEATVATYIFGSNKDDKVSGKEVLIKSSWGVGERTALKSLMPKKFLDQEVLNSLVSMLSHTERLTSMRCTCWFLPTTVSQYALNWTKSPRKVMTHYKEDSMSSVEFVSKIFLPINDENLHWFLLVVDMKLEELILLDSSPCPTRNEWRKESVKILAMYLEQMLMDDSFYEYPSTPKPKITKFTLVQPTNLSPQISGSNDCGVFVAQWMRECIWTDDYKDIYVCDGKRMRLALDLVLKPYNEMKAVVISLAFNYMNHLAKERKALVKNDGKAWNFYLSPI